MPSAFGSPFSWCLLIALMACSDSFYVVGVKGGPSSREPDGGSPSPMPWGSWAAQLDVPACPPAPTLVVDTIEDQLAADFISTPSEAGAQMSLTEALWIAHNRPGPDTILFDADVFPLDAPATIPRFDTFSMPQNLTETCIDARGRGVIVSWAPFGLPGGPKAQSSVWDIGRGSLQVGLELHNLPASQRLSIGGQIAGSRYFAGAFVSPIPSWIEIQGGGHLGPGNVFEGAAATAAATGTSGSVEGNFIGCDPRARIDPPIPMEVGLRLDGEAWVDNNVFASSISAISFFGAHLRFRHNWVGLEPGTLSPLTAPVVGVRLESEALRAVIGPENKIRASLNGIEVNGSTATTVTQSTFYSGVPISYVLGAPVEPPVITAADANGVAGTCAERGTIEVFSGEVRRGLPEHMLGATYCIAAGPWILPLHATSGSTLTATLTQPAGGTSTFSTVFPVP